MSEAKLKVALIGSGNWGCAIARIVGWNVREQSGFEERVPMYVYEEDVRGRKLTEIINTTHENVKYLPGYKLPDNIVAIPNAAEAASGADILIINMPHQVLPKTLETMKDSIKPGALAISLIKGHVEVLRGRPVLGSSVIRETLGIDTSVLMGANVAQEVARGDFCEATIASETERVGHLLKLLFHRPNFHIQVTTDIAGTELCGGLKNVIALGAGFCDGLNLGSNTKAAIIRIGLLEMSRLIQHFFPSSKPSTMFESCGVADLITTCFGGRNRKCAEAFAKDPSKNWEDIERNLLGGQKLQGVSTARDIYPLIKAHRLHKKLPLMRTIYRIACEGYPAKSLCDFATDEGPGALLLQDGQKRKRVAILGSGNWGCAIARIIGQNCEELEEFEDEINMYVHEELVEGRNLSDIINTEHENTKYMPGFQLPKNIRAVPSAAIAARGADILIFVLPAIHLKPLLDDLETVKADLSQDAFAVSLIKGDITLRSDTVDGKSSLQPVFASTIIQEHLGIPCAVLAGANIANEIAQGCFAESTLAARDSWVSAICERVFHLPTFQVSCISDLAGIESLGGLNNVIALAAGFCDGMGLGGNTKAAIIRIGLQEVAHFTSSFFPEIAQKETLFQSCGVADLLVMSMSQGGRNRRCAEHFAGTAERTHRLVRKMNDMAGSKTGNEEGLFGKASEKGSEQNKLAWRAYTQLLWEDIEKETLAGQFCQGIHTLRDLWPLVQAHKMEAQLPLLTTIWTIAVQGAPPSTLIQFGDSKQFEPPLPPALVGSA